MYYKQGYPIIAALVWTINIGGKYFSCSTQGKTPCEEQRIFHSLYGAYIYQVADDKEKLRFRRTLKQFPFLINQNLPLSNSNEQPQNFVSKFRLSSLIRQVLLCLCTICIVLLNGSLLYCFFYRHLLHDHGRIRETQFNNKCRISKKGK